MEEMPQFEEASKRKRRRRKNKPSPRRTEQESSDRKIAWIVGGLVITVSVVGAFLIGREYAPAEAGRDREGTKAKSASPVPAVVTATDIESSERKEAMKSFDEGMNALSRNDLKEARASFLRALEADPTMPGVYYQLARISLAERESIEAIDKIDLALERGEGAAECYRLQAEIYKGAGNNEQAYEALALAARADPGSSEVYFDWGEMLRRDGQLRESVEKLEKAADRSLAQAEGFAIRTKLELAYAELGEGGDGDDGLQELQNVAPEKWIGAAARAMKQESFDEARSYLGEARAAMNENFYRWAISDSFFNFYRIRPELKDALTPGGGKRIRPATPNKPE